LDVDQLEEVVVALENVGVTLLADLALELFPVVARHIFTIFFNVPLRLYPILKTLEVDQADRTSALARQNQWIDIVFFGSPTKTAVDLFLG